ncbi:Uma2 family endonuclease [Streptomyces venezuelae]|uniref:Uma2 family endonuclease n=1 Tax=Streptomyces venezuelae TaxID=54571 RepID=A0A5P2D5Y7_STRVZ|nr:Uma2 family endonuclease [Streptomyces venezuelae]QES50456.1 Uma2 family endonuclease [Streptomyces venezuelae]
MTATYEELRRLAEEIAAITPSDKKFKIEIDGPEILTSMVSRTTAHGMIVLRLRRQIEAQASEMVALNDTNLENPQVEKLRVPDLMALPEDSLDPTTDAVSSELVELVAEVVSKTNPENDYVKKLKAYPAMNIPVYLLIDPRKGAVTVYSDPVAGVYRASHEYAFGDTVPAGRWTIDSSVFPRYTD